jgi:phage tail sheath gpL-like
MATPIVQVKIIGKTAGSDLASALSGFKNVAIANGFRNIGKWFESIGMGMRSFNGFNQSGGVQATGTVTLSSMVANDTVTINGTTFTCVNSGATGNQFNKGGTDTITAANLAAAINASATAQVVNNVVATSALTVVTVTCKEVGTIGNLCTLAISGDGSVSGANLTGGTDVNVVAMAKGI